MKCFVRNYKTSTDYPKIFNSYFEGLKSCVFDIETTGLDSSRCKVILVAFLVKTDSGISITQFLAENHFEENKVLEASLNFIEREKINYFITFNGAGFDLPFFNKRLEHNYTDKQINNYNFDLYRFLTRNTDLKLKIGSMRQKSLEEHYGISSSRQDIISSRESIVLFDKYSLTGNSTLEKILLTHNREDVLQLYKLLCLSIREISDMDSAMAGYGFPIMDGLYTVRPALLRKKSVLRINGDQNQNPVSAAFFPDGENEITSIFNARTGLFEVSVPVSKYQDHFFLDIQSMGIDISSDPDYINGYLILNSRTINRLSSILVEKIVNEKKLI
ncbi:MAG TPA: ribonuclease H-like domain-containing protein [Mogibacterium sp.]|nr:ribonuclease H-like domain-containing protein [Mogibacterium sp.]